MNTSLIIPVYRNEETLPGLLVALAGIHRDLSGQLDVVFVVDGSPDDCHAILSRDLPGCCFSSELVHLSRNFGSFAAIRAGLEMARGPWFAVMAADLQEPPSLIIDFARTLQDDSVDLVFGQRLERDDPVSSKLMARIFWGIYRRLIQSDVPSGGVDVFACNTRVRDALVKLEETNSSLVGQLFWLGFRRRFVGYQRQARAGTGVSGWTLRKRVRYMLDSIFAFTDLPIVFITVVGFLGIIGSIGISGLVTWAWILGQIPVLGYTPLMLMITLSLSLTLFTLGILGGYLWRTYENTKGRPLFIPMTHNSFRKETPP